MAKESDWASISISAWTEIFNPDSCLVCGDVLSGRSDLYSQEHIFPKWFLRRYELWNERLTLLNSSQIKYKDLKIPCCKDCNNRHLSAIESIVRAGFVGGYDELIKIPPSVLVAWLVKIHLGLLRKECTLSVDRGLAQSQKILNTHDLAPYRVLQAVLKGVAKDYSFSCNVSEHPASLFIYRIKDGTGPNFNYHDTWSTMCLMLKAGEVGILAVFDMGALAHRYSELFKRYEAYALHYEQFLELTARAIERSASYTHSPLCTLFDNEERVSVDVVSSYLSSGFYEFGDFSIDIVAGAFEALGGRGDTLYNPKDWGNTLLLNADGSFREI